MCMPWISKEIRKNTEGVGGARGKGENVVNREIMYIILKKLIKK